MEKPKQKYIQIGKDRYPIIEFMSNGDWDIGFLEYAKCSHPIFKAVEQYFWEWIGGSGQRFNDLYYSQDSIYDKKEAIKEGVWAICEYLFDSDATILTPKHFYKVDLEGLWE